MRITIWMSPKLFWLIGLIGIGFFVSDYVRSVETPESYEIIAHLFKPNMEFTRCTIHLRD
jgi:hypothetical protein